MSPEPVAAGVWLRHFPLSMLGMKMGRNVTVLKLSSNRTVIHSTAPFTSKDVAEISSVGEPGWLVEGTNFHDTFAREGASAFPGIPYLVPDGFGIPAGVEKRAILPAPTDWEGEIKVVRVAGMPKINEHVFLHRSSETLVVSDLLFNLTDDFDQRTRTLFRWLSGIEKHPGSSRLFRFLVKDRAAFEGSLREILSLEFENLVPGHGKPIVGQARERLGNVFADLGYAV